MSNSVVPQVVARSHLANSLLTVEWTVNMLMRDASPPSGAFSQLASMVLGSIPSAWGGVLLLGRLELHLFPSMKHKGFIEARQPVDGKKNWYKVPQRVSPIQRAVKWNSGKYVIQKHRGVRKWQRCGCFNSLQRRGCDSKYSREFVPTPSKFRVLEFRGFQKATQFSAFPEFAARFASPGIYRNLGSA